MDTKKDDKSTQEAVALKEHEEAGSEESAATEETVTNKDESVEAADVIGDTEGADDLEWEPESERPSRSAGSGVLSGAGAVVAAGLGLVSVSGTWLGTMLSDRAQLTGQIYAQANSGKVSPSEQIAQLYGKPWHTLAGVNGLFALVAVVLAVVVLVLTGKRMAIAQHPVWVRALAWGAVALGAIGLLISIAMYTDLFASLPAVASTSAGTGSTGG
jgi:hypothetical protein